MSLIFPAMAYIGCALLSAGVMSAMGEKNPNTKDGSVTGDAFAELLLIALWPVFWLWLGGRHLAQKVGP